MSYKMSHENCPRHTSVLVAGLRTRLGAGNTVLGLVAQRRDFASAAERFRIPVLHPTELLKKVNP
jgi:hypothetical protein